MNCKEFRGPKKKKRKVYLEVPNIEGVTVSTNVFKIVVACENRKISPFVYEYV